MNTTEAYLEELRFQIFRKGKLYLEEYDDEVGDREMNQKESHPRFSLVHKTLPDRGTLKKEMKKSNAAF